MSNDYESDFGDPLMDDSASPFEEAGMGGGIPMDEPSDQATGPELPKFRRPKVDLYSVLLILSLVFIILATVIHYYETTPYEYGSPPYKPGSQIYVPPPK